MGGNRVLWGGWEDLAIWDVAHTGLVVLSWCELQSIPILGLLPVEPLPGFIGCEPTWELGGIASQGTRELLSEWSSDLLAGGTHRARMLGAMLQLMTLGFAVIPARPPRCEPG